MTVLTLILAGGQGSRLSILGEKRAKPNGVQIWQPYQGRKDQDWYRGTADALYQNRNLIAESGCDRVLVLSGDHIYKQDYSELLDFHDAKGADLTVAVMNVAPADLQACGGQTLVTQEHNHESASAGGQACPL